MMNEVVMSRAAFVAGAGVLACALAGCSGGFRPDDSACPKKCY